MLNSRLGGFADLNVADLYAGSGALGLEALSRGAAQAVFVETDRAAVTAIESNAASLGASGRVAVRSLSAAKLPTGQSFDLIFADPPYAPGSGTAAAQAVASAEWLSHGGWMAVETHKGDKVSAPEGWTVDAERDVGRARITLLYLA